MQRIRITVRHNPDDPADDLLCAANIRRDLWAHSAVEIDPGSPLHGTHRDGSRNAFFEFATDRLPEVYRVLHEFGYTGRASVEVVQEGAGTECVNCGHIAHEPLTICPNCQFRDIDRCPYCENEVARLAYLSLGGDVFQCPRCRHRVRFQFNEPLIDADGHYNQPLVRVVPTEAPVAHDV